MTEDRNPGSDLQDNCKLYRRRGEEIRKLALMADAINYEEKITGSARREIVRLLADNEETRADITSTIKHLVGVHAVMTGSTVKKDSGLQPLDGDTVCQIEELANEAIDLNQGVRRLLDCDLEEIPTTGQVLTSEIDRRLARLINLLDGENEDEPPLKVLKE